MRTKDGCLLFSVNGQNLGVAAVGIPEKIYGVLDLYGQAAEASVVQAEGTCPPSMTCVDTLWHILTTVDTC